MKNRVAVITKYRIILNEIDSGSVFNYNREDIYVYEKCKDYYLIFVNLHSFLYLHKSVFSTPEDLETFESKILPAYTELKRSLKHGLIYLLLVWGICFISICILCVIIAFARSNHPLP